MAVLVRNVKANFYSSRGATKKYHELKKRGLPSFKNWRFITLTVDPKNFRNAQGAYISGKERIRYFVRTLRSDLGLKKLDHLWKLEFTEQGYAHWHLLIKYFEPVDIDRLRFVWSLGRIDVQRVTGATDMSYLFKYICKDAATELPAWFLKLHKPRIYSQSGVFPPVQNPNEGQESSRVGGNSRSSDRGERLTLGQRIERDEKTAFLWEDDQEGLFPRKVELKESFDTNLNNLVIHNQAKFGNTLNELVLDEDMLDNMIKNKTKEKDETD